MDDTAATEVAEIGTSFTLINDQGVAIECWELIDKNTFRLGRSEGNDVVLPFSWVSRKHAMVQVEENGIHNIIDLGSANGTVVNGKRIYTPTPLKSGDTVMIGKTSLVFAQDDLNLDGSTVDDLDMIDKQTVAFVEKEIVTVLICDIHGFTQLSEQLGDQQISQLLQEWSDKVTTVVREHGGIVDKFIGDAVMAMWIGGKLQKGAILSAMRAALSINRITRIMGEEWPGNPLKLEIGGALNTGEAVLGNMGGSGRRDYTVVGDMVNVAFRLEGMTSRDDGIDLVVGEETAARLDDAESCFTSQTYNLKGKKSSTKAFVCSFPQLKEYLLKQATTE